MKITQWQSDKSMLSTCGQKTKKAEATTLWKRARNAKEHHTIEQKGCGKQVSLCFLLSQWQACADVKLCLMTSSLPFTLPGTDVYLWAWGQCWKKQPGHCCIFDYRINHVPFTTTVRRIGDLCDPRLHTILGKAGIFSICASCIVFLARSEKSTVLAAFCSLTR